MNRLLAAAGLLAAGLVAVCGPGASSNPGRLWLAPNTSEIDLELSDTEPPFF